ncbi:zf-HC2 domain-containing protein [Paucibacter sp. PLA-PC-4]|uniref:anti-sigma factor family protein n=1 Tax=Paucibacter sp. PLA-PC-4 TaxID=2993655 RepID=UPI002248FCEC|nr:zf-HC2 domain-containing protein [Paucibacter sp. PLA-PC-4]MCX2861796.1 zf-HC2 domain-containing protein [Paucibacter sp. PLA-PC-4]
MLSRSCRQVTHLVLQAEDRALPLRDRLAVRLHMLMCKACPRFADQLALMRSASKRWRQYSESQD